MPDRKPELQLIDRLVEEAGPVRRLWAPGARLLAWLALLGVAAAVIGLRSGWPFAGPERYPGLPWEVLAAAAVAAFWAGLALCAAIPGREPTTPSTALAGALTPLPALFWLWGAAAQPHTPLAAFVASGAPCALRTALFALLLFLPLLWAQRRGAPLQARRTAGLAAGAGFLAGYVLMRFFCSVDEPAHLFAWHALPLPLGAGIAAAAGSWILASWRRDTAR
jgi:hypothetical protein